MIDMQCFLEDFRDGGCHDSEYQALKQFRHSLITLSLAKNNGIG